MDSGIIGKIQKAKRYATEPERIHFEEMRVRFDGTNNDHVVNLKDGTLHCTCDFYQSRLRCSHTMALEIVLIKMLPETATAY